MSGLSYTLATEAAIRTKRALLLDFNQRAIAAQGTVKLLLLEAAGGVQEDEGEEEFW